jgi:hypothetical protein
MHGQPAYYVPMQASHAAAPPPPQVTTWYMPRPPVTQVMQPFMMPPQVDPALAWTSAAWYRQETTVAQTRFQVPQPALAEAAAVRAKPGKRTMLEDAAAEIHGMGEGVSKKPKEQRGQAADHALAPQAAPPAAVPAAAGAHPRPKKIAATRIVKPNYSCGKCGQLKRGHVCAVADDKEGEGPPEAPGSQMTKRN